MRTRRERRLWALQSQVSPLTPCLSKAAPPRWWQQGLRFPKWMRDGPRPGHFCSAPCPPPPPTLPAPTLPMAPSLPCLPHWGLVRAEEDEEPRQDAWPLSNSPSATTEGTRCPPGACELPVAAPGMVEGHLPAGDTCLPVQPLREPCAQRASHVSRFASSVPRVPAGSPSPPPRPHTLRSPFCTHLPLPPALLYRGPLCSTLLLPLL